MKKFSTPASRARDEAARRAKAGSGVRGHRRLVAAGFAAGLAVGLVAGVGLGAGVVSGGTGDDDEVSLFGDRGVAEPADQASPEEPVRPAETITLAFAGDIHFENHLAVLAQDPDSLAELRDSLGAADLAMANLETAVTERGTPIPGKPFTWRAPAGAIDAVAGAGVDVISMANNHAADYGDVGLRDTLAAVEAAPVPIIGIGRDEQEAYAPAILDVRGVKVAFVNASQIVEETFTQYAAGPSKPGIATALPRDRLLRSVREAREQADVVVAYVHWGLEGYTCPGDEAITSAQELEKAGADVILGDHAHRVNGAGWVGDAYVHFGLGNFVYYMSTEPAGHTGVLTVTVDVPASDEPRPDRPLVTDADWDAMLISGDGIPRRQDAYTTQRLQQTFEASRECTPARATP